MVAYNNSPQSPTLNDQVPINPRLGIETPLGHPKHLPQQEMTPSPVAPDENNDNFLGIYYGVDVEALNDWATVTQFMKTRIRFVVQEPENTEEFKQFMIKLYGPSWEKRVLCYQLYALIMGYGKTNPSMKRPWLNQFDSGSSSQLRAQLKGLAEAGSFLKLE